MAEFIMVINSKTLNMKHFIHLFIATIIFTGCEKTLTEPTTTETLSDYEVMAKPGDKLIPYVDFQTGDVIKPHRKTLTDPGRIYTWDWDYPNDYDGWACGWGGASGTFGITSNDRLYFEATTTTSSRPYLIRQNFMIGGGYHRIAIASTYPYEGYLAAIGFGGVPLNWVHHDFYEDNGTLVTYLDVPEGQDDLVLYFNSNEYDNCYIMGMSVDYMGPSN